MISKKLYSLSPYGCTSHPGISEDDDKEWTYSMKPPKGWRFAATRQGGSGKVKGNMTIIGIELVQYFYAFKKYRIERAD